MRFQSPKVYKNVDHKRSEKHTHIFEGLVKPHAIIKLKQNENTNRLL